MRLTEEGQDLKRELYDWFFKWDGKLERDETTKKYHWLKDEKCKGDDSDENNIDAESKTDEQIAEEARKAQQDKDDRLKLKKEREMMDFEDKGGFEQVLKDIFNPSDLAAMELDSVFQLKNLCKDFYRKKQLLSGNLVQTLDALSNERPGVLQSKRRNFNADDSGNSQM